jgi:hypothetical protein
MTSNLKKEIEEKIKKIKDIGCIECYCETPSSKVQLCEVCQEEVKNLRKQLKVINKALFTQRQEFEKILDELKEHISANWKHYQYNYNSAGSKKRKKELLQKLDELKQKLGEIK